MAAEPPENPRAVFFVDGQNLFHAAKQAFGYRWPNYDARALAARICGSRHWTLAQTRFYTGVPEVSDDPFWNHFWHAKFAAMGRTPRVHIFWRSLRYRNQTVRLPDGTDHTFLVGQEKGIDVRLALDLVRLAQACLYDVGVIVSQDQDLTEAVQ